MDELDLSAFRYGGANFTGFRLVDRENSQLVRNVQMLWTRLGAAYHRNLPDGDLLKVIVNVIFSAKHYFTQVRYIIMLWLILGKVAMVVSRSAT